MDWIPGAIRLDDGAQSGTQDTSYPARLVLHTTEGGGTVQSLANFYKSSTYWPHFTADLTNHVLAQHLPLSRAGRALSHERPTQTNGAHCIQVEIIGRAAESQDWKDEDVAWLGQALAPVFKELDIEFTAPRFVGAAESPAGEPRPQRMTDAVWAEFNGVCGHQHVPQNDHWDPGAMDIHVFLVAAGAAEAPGPVPAPKPVTITVSEDNMKQLDYVVPRLDDHGRGYFPVKNVKAKDVHAITGIATKDPAAVPLGYEPLPTFNLTIGKDGFAEVVISGGKPGGRCSVRVLHS